MVSVSNVPGQCRQHQKWLNYKSNITADHVLTALKPKLHIALGPTQQSLVNLIILQASNILELDDPETRDILHSDDLPNIKFIKLTNIVECWAASDPNFKEKFINVLLNTTKFTHDVIKSLITQEFANSVEIETAKQQTSCKQQVDSQQDIQEQPLLFSNESFSQASNETKTNAITTFVKNHLILCGIVLGFVVTVIMLPIFIFLSPTIIRAVFGQSSGGLLLQNGSDISTPLGAGTTNIPDYPQVTTESNVSPLSPSQELLTTTIDTAVSTALIPTNIPSTLQNENARGISNGKKKRKHRVIVSSYSEYVLLMSKIPLDREVILSIKLESPLSWPNGQYGLINSLEIHRLSLDGPFSVDILVDILGQTTNIIHLHLKNSGNKLCQRNLGQLSLVKTIKSKFYLPVLRTMVLEEFTTCAEVYETLAVHSEELKELKGIAIRNGVLDDSNHYFIQQLLQLSRENLRHFQLSETKIESSIPLFEVASGLRLPKLETIRLDSLSINGANGTVPIGSLFVQMFPNLRSIVSVHGFLNWRNMSNILVFRNLTKLQIGIDVPEFHTSFNVAFVRKAFPVIKSVSINLNFEKCHNEKNQIVGWETVRETLQEISIGSNCKIYANFSMMPWQMRALREEKYSQSVLNAKYCFTYRLLADRK